MLQAFEHSDEDFTEGWKIRVNNKLESKGRKVRGCRRVRHSWIFKIGSYTSQIQIKHLLHP